MRTKRKQKAFARLIMNLSRTWKNKLAAVVFITIGVLCTMLDGDATVLMLSLMFGVPLFFTNKEVVC